MHRSRTPKCFTTVADQQVVTLDVDLYKNFDVECLHANVDLVLGNPRKPGRRGYVLVSNASTTLTCRLRVTNTELVLLGASTVPADIPPRKHLYFEYIVLHENVPGILIHEARDLPPALTYDPATLVATKGVAIADMGPTLTGGAATLGFTAVPLLPAGLTLDATTGLITGTPTAVQAQATYRIDAENHGGVGSTTLAVTVVDVPVLSLAYAPTATISAVVGVPIAARTPTTTGGAATAFTVDPLLPAGLTLHPTTGTLAGTPTQVQATSTSYTVTASNSAATTAAAVVTLTAVAAGTLVYTSAALSLLVGVPGTTGVPATNVPEPRSYTVEPALPAGLALDPATGEISGTCSGTVASTAHTVSVFGSGSATVAAATQVVTIDAVDLVVSYLSFQTLVVHQNVAPVLPTVIPASATVGNFTSPGLIGMTIDAATGAITGAPDTVQGPSSLTIFYTPAGGTQQVTSWSVEVVAPTVNYLSKTLAVHQNVATPILPTVIPASATVGNFTSPGLIGMTIDAATGAITGAPDTVQGPSSLTIFYTPAGGTQQVTSWSVEVVAPTVAYQYSTLSAPAFALPSSGLLDTTISPAVTPVAAAVGDYSSPDLPAGMSLDASTGIITGKPDDTTQTVSVTVNYIPVGGTQQQTSFAIDFNDAPIAYTGTVSPGTYVLPVGQYATITPADGWDFPGNVEVGVASNFHLADGTLPAGLTLNAATGTITGTPQLGISVIHQMNYTYTNAANTSISFQAVALIGLQVQ